MESRLLTVFKPKTTIRKPGKRVGRWLSRFLLLAVAAVFTLLPLAQPAKAQWGVPDFIQGGAQEPTSPYFRSVSWDRIDTVTEARRFFGITTNEPDSSLVYRIRVGNNYIPPSGGEDETKDAVTRTKKRPSIDVFRLIRKPNGEASLVPLADYFDPKPSNHRSLTLKMGFFGKSDALASAVHTATEPGIPNAIGAGAGLAFGVPGAVAGFLAPGAIDGLFGGDDSHAVWVFSGDGNKNVQNTLTCNDQDNRDSMFVYSDDPPVVTLGKNSELDGEDKIGDLNRVGGQGAWADYNFNDSSLGDYLCAPTNEDDFTKLCEGELDLPTAACPYNVETFGDALKEFLPDVDPLSWAISKMRDVVGFFMGFIVDGVRNISDVGDLSSSSGVTEAWKAMRDLANVVFILILAAIAFSTMLRIDTQRYGLRSLLPRLVLAIIGVNFSLLFMTILVNTATVLGNPFLSGLNRVLDQNPAGNVDALSTIGQIGQQIVLLLASLVVAIVLLLLLLLLVVRVVMIWILAALAPLAFLFSVLPFSRSLASQWLKQTLKWVYMAPIAYAILWIGAKFLSAADSLGTTILSILVFIGVVIAAIVIPLKLGGEIMQRASNAGKGAGKFAGGKALKSTSAGRAAGAYMKRRQEAQEQGAQLRASGWQGAVSQRFPGRLGQALTGGSPAQIGAQQAALENKYAGDIKDMGNKVGVPERKMIAQGKVGELRGRGLHEAADLAGRPEGRRAAGRLLGQGGHLTRGFMQELPEGQRNEQIAAGNQGFMKDYDPVLAAKNSQGQITPESLQGIKSHVGAVGPEATKEMYWGDIRKASFEPGKEGEAGQAALGAVSTVSAAENVKAGARHQIAADGERDAFIRGVLRHGSTKSKQALYDQLKGNNDGSDQKYKKLAEGFGVNT